MNSLTTKLEEAISFVNTLRHRQVGARTRLKKLRRDFELKLVAGAKYSLPTFEALMTEKEKQDFQNFTNCSEFRAVVDSSALVRILMGLLDSTEY